MILYKDILDSVNSEAGCYELHDAFLAEGYSISFNGRVDCAGDIFLLVGNISAEYHTACDRCLKDITISIDDEVSIALSPDMEHELTREREADDVNSEGVALGDDEAGIVFTEREGFDLHSILESEVILATPTKCLCKDDCKGLCSNCGADLNEGKCGCKDVPTGALSKLADLK